jgi:Txe/YoeB family toxin of toxin-antitoxin system
MYKVVFTPHAVKDAVKLEQAGLKPKAIIILRIVKQNPFQNPPQYEKLSGLRDTYSRRINRQHRFVYQILPNTNGENDENGVPFHGVVKVIRMWTHYE